MRINKNRRKLNPDLFSLKANYVKSHKVFTEFCKNNKKFNQSQFRSLKFKKVNTLRTNKFNSKSVKFIFHTIINHIAQEVHITLIHSPIK